MLEIVLTRASGRRHAFDVLAETSDTRVDVAVVDADQSLGMTAWQHAQARWPHAVAVYVSDEGRAGDGPHRVPRRTLLSRIGAVLDDAVRALTVPATATASTDAARRSVAESAAPVALAEPQVPFEAAPAQGPLQALVVDDSATVRGQLEQALGRIGFQVDTAANADEAALAVLKKSYDLVFLDVVMPGTDGYTFCRNVRSNKSTKSLPVVMLTSRSSPFDRARGALAGCDTYLTKPIDLQTFHGAVDRMVMKRFKNDRAAVQRRGYTLKPA